LLIRSTRAILIKAPKQKVWRWLMQLGADRAGFFSYDFLERALGYETRFPDMLHPRFKNLSVGDVVRGSTDDQKSLIPYDFPVSNIKPEDSLVLANWGTFLLKRVGDRETLLIARTQEKRSQNIFLGALHYLFVPFHYIMERRMLIGIKLHAEGESGIQYSQSMDILWLVSIALSWLLIALLILIGRGLVKKFVFPALLSIMWLCVVLLLNPIPIYSFAFLLALCMFFFASVLKGVRSEKNE